jgi:hypothetical protein
MSKKRRKKAGGIVGAMLTSPVMGGSRRRRYYVAALSAFALLTAVTAASRFNAVRRAAGLRPLPAASLAQATPTPLPLSKEYVYAGGRLVATEEPAAAPTPTPAGSPPTNLVAAATSASSVTLTWAAPGAGVLGYVVERRAASGTQEISTGSSSTSFDDTTPSGDYAYLYRVKAVYAGGASLYSNQDLATTVMFTDSPLRGVTIKAAHLTELRRAVNAVRRLVPNLGDASWTYPDPVSSPAPQRRAVYLEDVTDLRARLDEALGPLGLPAGGYPSIPTLARGAVVNADHFEQIRQRVR